VEAPDFIFADGTCLFCGQQDRAILICASRPEAGGACEKCGVDFYWAWKKLLTDSAPTPAAGEVKIGRVKVLITKRRTLPGGKPAPLEIPESHEVMMAAAGDGTIDLPSTSLEAGEDEISAVRRLLAELEIASWPRFFEPVYAAHVPRGQLARVYLVSAWTPVHQVDAEPRYQFRRWPPGEHAQSMASFYLGLELVWRMRLRAHRLVGPPLGEVSLQIRRGAAEYIRIQERRRSGRTDVDTSMTEYLRRQMSDDEKAVDKLLLDEGELLAERAGQEEKAPPPEPEAEWRETALAKFEESPQAGEQSESPESQTAEEIPFDDEPGSDEA